VCTLYEFYIIMRVYGSVSVINWPKPGAVVTRWRRDDGTRRYCQHTRYVIIIIIIVHEYKYRAESYSYNNDDDGNNNNNNNNV